MMIKDRKLWCNGHHVTNPTAYRFLTLLYLMQCGSKDQKSEEGKLYCGLGLSNLQQFFLQHNFPPQLQWDIRKKEATKQDAPSFPPCTYGCHDNTLRKEKDERTSRIKTVAHIRALSLVAISSSLVWI